MKFVPALSLKFLALVGSIVLAGIVPGRTTTITFDGLGGGYYTQPPEPPWVFFE
jgi:hypothetical protein